MRRRRLLLAGASGVGALILTLGLGWWRSRDDVQSGSSLVPLPIGEMSFTLTDHRDITLWLEELGPDADRLNTVLISVDPERDTPEVLADYLSNFDPRITGLTGPLGEIERAASGFRATFEKIPQGDRYTMNHTAGVLLFRADGGFGGIVDYHEDRRLAVPKIRRLLE